LNALSSHPVFANVTSLSFRGAHFGDAGAAVLANKLSSLPALQWLDLSDCGITHVGCGHLSSYIYRSEDPKDRRKRGPPPVFGSNEDMDVAIINSNNPISKPVRVRRVLTEGWDVGTSAKSKTTSRGSGKTPQPSSAVLAARLNASAGRYVCPLLGLSMSHNPIGDDGARVLCGALARSHLLKELDINYCGLTAKSCTYIAAMASSTASVLESLSVRGNDFGVFGCTTLLQGLWNRETLKRLDVGATRMLNPIHNPSTQHRRSTIVGITRANVDVKDVGASTNPDSAAPAPSRPMSSGNLPSGDDGGDAMDDNEIDAVPMAVQDYNSVIASLPVELHGLTTLVYAIRSCPSLASISLDGNGVDSRGARLLLDNLADLAHVREMSIDQRIDGDVYKELQQWLLRNKPAKKKKKPKKKERKW